MNVRSRAAMHLKKHIKKVSVIATVEFGLVRHKQ